MIRYKKSSDEMNRGLKVYKDNRKRGTVKLRGKIGTNIQRNRGIHGQKNGWKEKRRNIRTEGGPEDKPSPHCTGLRVERSWVERFRVERSRVERSWIERSRVERSWFARDLAGQRVVFLGKTLSSHSTSLP